MKEVNPLKSIRERANLTQEAVAEHAGVSRQYVIRAEQAVFASLPLRVADALLDLIDDDSQDIQALSYLYDDWQRLRREESFGALTPGFDFHEHAPPYEQLIHPFEHWRRHSGLTARISVSKLFCVHPALMFKFEVQPWLVVTVPSELLVALRQSGYHPDDLSNLEKAYEVYRVKRRG